MLLFFLLFETFLADYLALLAPFGRSSLVLRGTDPQVSHSDQIVSRYCQGKVPVDLLNSSVAGLAELAGGFQPTEDFFYPLAELLAHGVATVPSGATVNGGTAFSLGVLRDMRRNFHCAHGLDKFLGVVVLVSCYRYAALLGSDLGKHGLGGIPLGKAIGFGNLADDNQSVPIFGQDVRSKRHLCFMGAALAVQSCFRVSR